MPVPDYQPIDTCARCGLPRRTRELEQQGVFIRLCDECYWGREFTEQPPPARKLETDAPPRPN